MSDLSLDATQLDRYSRHIIMDEVGPEGQKRLLDSSALVVGAGGLGAPVIQYLAAAGVGTIGVVDDDVVERSNLQRQVIHGDDDVGRPKVDSARDFVAALNPDVGVDTYEARLDRENADVLTDYDVVVDASDNDRLADLLAANESVDGVDRGDDGQVVVTTDDPEGFALALPRILTDANLGLYSVDRQGGLEERFLDMLDEGEE